MAIDYKSWLAQAEARLAELDTERARLLAIVENARALANVSATTHAVTPSQRVAPVQRTPRPARVATKMDMTRVAVREALQEAGEPLETRALVPLVKAKGVEVGGKDDIATLSARLSNSGDHFTLHRGVGWWFVDRALPGAFSSFDEAEGQSSQAEPSASDQETEGGESNAAALA